MKRDLLLSAILFSFLACDDPPPRMMMGPPPLPTEVALADFCATTATAECFRLEQCSRLYAPWSLATCESWQIDSKCSALADQYGKLQSLGHIVYDATQAAACRDSIFLPSDCGPGFDRDFLATEVCQTVVRGLSQEGASCTISQACVDGLTCDASAQVCPGTCRTLKGNNDICGGDDVCGPGLFCALNARVCRAVVALGAPCGSSSQGNSCVAGSFCDNSSPTGALCVRGRGRNTGCTTDYECADSMRCFKNLCSAGKDGDTCLRDSNCDAGLRCSAVSRCAVPSVETAECNIDSQPCVHGLACVEEEMLSTCVARPVLGESCSEFKPCLLGRCVDDQCVAAAADGGACMSREDCLPGRFCNDGLCAPDFACRL
jgi:hypothetical protein